MALVRIGDARTKANATRHGSRCAEESERIPAIWIFVQPERIDSDAVREYGERQNCRCARRRRPPPISMIDRETKPQAHHRSTF